MCCLNERIIGRAISGPAFMTKKAKKLRKINTTLVFTMVNARFRV